MCEKKFFFSQRYTQIFYCLVPNSFFFNKCKGFNMKMTFLQLLLQISTAMWHSFILNRSSCKKYYPLGECASKITYVIRVVYGSCIYIYIYFFFICERVLTDTIYIYIYIFIYMYIYIYIYIFIYIFFFIFLQIDIC